MSKTPKIGITGIGRSLCLGVTCALLLAASAEVSQSQILGTMPITISGQTNDQAISFRGYGTFDLGKRTGSIDVKTSQGVACRGTSRLNRSFLSGVGQMQCENGVTSRFDIQITGIIPLRGIGTGIDSDGRKFTFQLRRAPLQ